MSHNDIASPPLSYSASASRGGASPGALTTTAVAVCRFYLNGELKTIPDADPLAPLATTIRERCNLPGTKVACGQGNCGACTVTLQYPADSVRASGAPICVNACLFPTGALFVDSRHDPRTTCVKVMTVEGAQEEPWFKNAGKEIAECNATQCGFCTAGMVMKAVYHEGRLRSGEATNAGNSLRDIEDLLEGNLCRCTGFRPILFALKKSFADRVPAAADRAKISAELEATPPLVVKGKDGSYKGYGTGHLTCKNVRAPLKKGKRVGGPDALEEHHGADPIDDREAPVDPSTAPGDAAVEAALPTALVIALDADAFGPLPSPLSATAASALTSPAYRTASPAVLPSPMAAGAPSNFPPAVRSASAVTALVTPVLSPYVGGTQLQREHTATPSDSGVASVGVRSTDLRATDLLDDVSTGSEDDGPAVARRRRRFSRHHRDPISALPPRALQQVAPPPPAEWPAVDVPTGRGDGRWITPTSLPQLMALIADRTRVQRDYRIIAGNAGSAWTRLYEEPPNKDFIFVQKVRELHGAIHDDGRGTVKVPANCTLHDWLYYLNGLEKAAKSDPTLDLVMQHTFATANIQVRHLGTLIGNIVYSNTRVGILHSDISLLFAALDAKMWYTTNGVDSHFITIDAFQAEVEPIPQPWIATHFTMTVPLSQFITVRVARTAPRVENFPTSCSAAYSVTPAAAYGTMRFTGPHAFAEGAPSGLPAPVLLSVGAALPTTAAWADAVDLVERGLREHPLFKYLAQSEHQIMLQMAARVLGADSSSSDVVAAQRTSMLEERKIEGQTANSQHFYVDPLQSPLTEPIVKDDAYLAAEGKARYPYDHAEPNQLCGAVVLSPVAVFLFDPYDLQDAGSRFVQSIDPQARLFTAASMPFDPEVDTDVESHVPLTWFTSKSRVDPSDHVRMFTGRNVMFGAECIGGNWQYGVRAALQPTVGKDRQQNKYGPGGFGEFVVAPGFTTHAGQVVAMVTHPSEVKARGMAKLVEAELKKALDGKTGALSDLTVRDATPELGIVTVERSRAMKKCVLGADAQLPVIFARGLSTWSATQCDDHKQYTEWWAASRANPDNSYVELLPGDFANDADGYADALHDAQAAADAARVAAGLGRAVAVAPILAASQTHVYMETQTCIISKPSEGRYQVNCATQGTDDICHALTRVLDAPFTNIIVKNARIGGGYGGKAIGAMQVASCCGFLAAVTGEAVRLNLDRRDDFMMIGKRHPMQGRYRAIVGSNPDRPDTYGRVLGLDLWLDSDAGCSTFISPCVMAFGGTVADSVYDIPNYRFTGNVYLTHKQSNTAFRSFGGIQATTIMESALDHCYAAFAAAHPANRSVSPSQFRSINFYRRTESHVPRTPHRAWISWANGEHIFAEYHQELLETDIMTDATRGIWATSALENDAFRAARDEVLSFNARPENAFRKRAIAAIPLKYPGGYDPKDTRFGLGPKPMDQNSALVNVYRGGGSYPGYVLIHQASVEMGQGVHVALRQAAAAALNLPLAAVKIAPVSSEVIPNSVCTGASSGFDTNLHAILEACQSLRRRLFAMQDGLLHAELLRRIAAPAVFKIDPAALEALTELVREFDANTGFEASADPDAPSRGWIALQKNAVVVPLEYANPHRRRSGSLGPRGTSPSGEATPDPYYQNALGSYQLNYYLASSRSWLVPEPVAGTYDQLYFDFLLCAQMYADKASYLAGEYDALLQAWDPAVGFGRVHLGTSVAWRKMINFMHTRFGLSPSNELRDLLIYARAGRPQLHVVGFEPTPLSTMRATRYWSGMVDEAFLNRLPLSAVGKGAPAADGGADVDCHNWYMYFVYCSAWAVVEVDGITGQTDVIRSDIYYDAGNSPNPAADIGQIEGAFVQGMGNILTEQCDWDPKTGIANQRCIMDCAIPDSRTIPRSLNTHLFWKDGADPKAGAGVDARPALQRRQQSSGKGHRSHRAKAASEASYCMSVVTLMAVRQAIVEIRRAVAAAPTGDKASSASFEFVPLSTPLIPTTVLQAIYGPQGRIGQHQARLA